MSDTTNLQQPYNQEDSNSYNKSPSSSVDINVTNFESDDSETHGLERWKKVVLSILLIPTSPIGAILIVWATPLIIIVYIIMLHKNSKLNKDNSLLLSSLMYLVLYVIVGFILIAVGFSQISFDPMDQ